MTTTTTTSTLSNRYVEATLRRLPGHQRADIERELGASIGDPSTTVSRPAPIRPRPR
jgi:hypothetical protein